MPKNTGNYLTLPQGEFVELKFRKSSTFFGLDLGLKKDVTTLLVNCVINSSQRGFEAKDVNGKTHRIASRGNINSIGMYESVINTLAVQRNNIEKGKAKKGDIVTVDLTPLQ